VAIEFDHKFSGKPFYSPLTAEEKRQVFAAMGNDVGTGNKMVV